MNPFDWLMSDDLPPTPERVGEAVRASLAWQQEEAERLRAEWAEEEADGAPD